MAGALSTARMAKGFNTGNMGGNTGIAGGILARGGFGTPVGTSTPVPSSVPRTGPNGNPDYSQYGGYDSWARTPEGQAWSRMQPPSRSYGPPAPSTPTSSAPRTSTSTIGPTIYANTGVSSDGGGGGSSSPAGPAGSPPVVPQVGTTGGDASAMLSIDNAMDFPEPIAPQEGTTLRQLGRRLYPQESQALAAMGRIY